MNTYRTAETRRESFLAMKRALEQFALFMDDESAIYERKPLEYTAPKTRFNKADKKQAYNVNFNTKEYIKPSSKTNTKSKSSTSSGTNDSEIRKISNKDESSMSFNPNHLKDSIDDDIIDESEEFSVHISPNSKASIKRLSSFSFSKSLPYEDIESAEINQKQNECSSFSSTESGLTASRNVSNALGYRMSKRFSRECSVKLDDESTASSALKNTVRRKRKKKRKMKKRKEKKRVIPIFVPDLKGFGGMGWTFCRESRKMRELSRLSDIPPIGAYYDAERAMEYWTKKGCMKFENYANREHYRHIGRQGYEINVLNPIKFKRNQRLKLIKDRGAFARVNKVIQKAR